jgi:hypothetical protein
VLPNKLGDDHLDFFESGMHSNIGPQNRYLRCGKSRSGKGECWLCDKIAELGESKKSSHRAAAEKMVRVDKFATQISPISDDSWLPPTLFEMPNSVANGLLGIMHRKAVTDLKKGYNLTVDRVGTTFKGTKYGSLVVDDEKSKVPSKIVEAMKTFDELVPKYSEAKQKEAYYGHEQDEEDEEEVTKKPVDDEEEEEEEKPKKKKKPVDEDEEEPDEEDSEFEELADEEEEDEKPKKKKKPADDEDEEEEPEEDEEEDEEEKPKKKKKPVDEDEEDALIEDEEEEEEDEEEEEKPKKKKKPVDEEEEEPEDEEEEEEEEKPKKKKKKKPVEEDEDE